MSKTNNYENILCNKDIYVYDIIKLFNENKNIEHFKDYLDENSDNFNWRDIIDICDWYDWFKVELNEELKEYEEYELVDCLHEDIGDVFKNQIEDRDITDILIKLDISDFERLNRILPSESCYIMVKVKVK